jgi:cytochrome b6
MSPFEMLKLLGFIFSGKFAAFGEIFGILLFTLAIVLWLLIPFYDTSKESGQRSRAANYFGLLVIFALLATTAIGYWTIR